MARVYLKAGGRIEVLCELTLSESGELEDAEAVEGATIRYFRKDEKHPDGGEWYAVRYDFDDRRDTNPRWGQFYYDDERPGY